MKTTVLIKWMLVMGITVQTYGQLNFDPQPLVTVPGVNTNFELSWDNFENSATVYIVWENQSEVNGFSIYRMSVWPDPGSPEIIATSNDSLRNPDVNYLGDVVWQAFENDYWVLKYYSQTNGEIQTLTDSGENSTQPVIGNSLLLYVQDSSLVYMNLITEESFVVDQGHISNPDLNPEAYNSYWRVVYEKQEQDTTSIFLAAKRIESPPFSISRYSTEMTNKYPRFGTMGGVVYQSLVEGVWNVVLNDWSSLQIPNATKPALLTVPVPVARVVEDWLILYECDSLGNNTEIYAYGFSGTDSASNISNLPGNDFNPQCSILSSDSVAVFWEHEIEGRREIWWAKDSLHIQGGAIANKPAQPSTFSIGKAFPNPFNGHIQVNYSVTIRSDIEVSIFNMNGEQIRRSAFNKRIGNYSYDWDGTDGSGRILDSGLYIIQFESSGSSLSRSIILIK